MRISRSDAGCARVLGLAASLSLLLCSCAGGDGKVVTGTGGAIPASGGSTGATGTGGGAGGGQPGTGGASSGTASGGAPHSGGAPGSGGQAGRNGQARTGGATSTGGQAGGGGSGGAASGGNAGGSGAVGAGGRASGGDTGGARTGGNGGSCNAGMSSARQTARALGTTAAKNGYLEYLPPNCGVEKAPLMVFWHGVGENGAGTSSDLARVAANGPPRLIRDNKWSSSLPFIVLSPQHRASGVLTSGFDCPLAAEIHDFMTYAIGAYPIDPTRVYLTGLSCGAMGSSNYLAQFGGEQVAAAVLVAGRSMPMWQSMGCALVNNIGLWAFHGDADPTVPISDDNMAMPQFIACPQPPRKDVRFTVYPGVGHDSWTRTYDMSAGHDVYTWLLGIKK